MKKKTMATKIIFALACLAGSVMLPSCSTLDNIAPPYIIANPRVELGKNEDVHQFAGAYMTVFNDSEKTIGKYTVSFLLYDADGSVPFVGTNCVVATNIEEIPPQSETECVVSLDSFMSVVPDEPYTIDFLYLREIDYTDGTRWSDLYGMFCLQEEE